MNALQLSLTGDATEREIFQLIVLLRLTLYPASDAAPSVDRVSPAFMQYKKRGGIAAALKKAACAAFHRGEGGGPG